MDIAQILANFYCFGELPLFFLQIRNRQHRIGNPLCPRSTQNTTFIRAADIHRIAKTEEQNRFSFLAHHASDLIEPIGYGIVIALEREEVEQIAQFRKRLIQIVQLLKLNISQELLRLGRLRRHWPLTYQCIKFFSRLRIALVFDQFFAIRKLSGAIIFLRTIEPAEKPRFFARRLYHFLFAVKTGISIGCIARPSPRTDPRLIKRRRNSRRKRRRQARTNNYFCIHNANYTIFPDCIPQLSAVLTVRCGRRKRGRLQRHWRRSSCNTRSVADSG